MLDAGVFVYPWDLQAEGVDAALGTIQRDLGMDAITLNVSYHSGRFMHPRHRGPGELSTFRGIVSHRHGASVSFHPDAAAYGRLKPVVEREVADARVVERAVAGAREMGLGVELWAVALHNSALGSAYEDVCVENAFGDVYRYALCPAHADVREYARALVRDLCARFQPDTLVLESPTYLGFVHGEHHELILEDLDDLTRWLLGFCFNPATCRALEENGLEAERVRETVAGLLEKLLEEGRGARTAAFRVGEPVSLLTRHPELFSYLRVRQSVVTSLLKELRAIAAGFGVRLAATSSIFERPASRAWSEGAELGQASRALDEIVGVSYFQDPLDVLADVQWMRTLIGSAPLTVALNVGHPDEVSAESLLAKIVLAQGQGVEKVRFYNYGLLTHRRLAWLRDAVGRARKEASRPE